MRRIMLLALTWVSLLQAYTYIGDGENPIFSVSAPWNSLAVIGPHVQVQGDLYRMWFAGRNVGLPIQIGYAESVDGRNWNETALPVLTVGPSMPTR